MATHRFAADVMLGRLATWLRLIGQDTAYGSHLSGATLLRLARKERRVVLTRDNRLARRADVERLFIESDSFRDQLRQVVAAYRLDPYSSLLTRCSRCNTPIEEISREQAAPRVPPYVAQTADRFMRCPRCHHIYWPGTHLQRIRTDLHDILS